MNKANRFGALLVIGLMLGSVSGCITLLPKPGKPPAIISMRGDPALNRVREQANFTIGVGLPTMPSILSGTQVTVQRKNRTYAYVEKLALAQNAPLSIQTVVLETFDNVSPTRAAVRALTVARPDYELHFDVSNFEVTEPEGRRPGMATVQVTARLIEVLTGRPLADTVIRTQAPARRGDVTQPALALEAATQQMALESMTWSVNTAKAFHASKAASTTR